MSAVLTQYIYTGIDSKAISEAFLISPFKGTVFLLFNCQEIQHIPPVNTGCLE